MHQAPIVLLVLATLFIAACSEAPEAPELAETAKEAPATSAIGQIDDARINNAASEPGNWLAHGRTYEEQRFSPLKQINKETVKDLGLAWYKDMDTNRALESTPIVVDGIMFFTSTWSRVYAIDAVTGEEKWSYDPKCLASGVVVDAVMSSIAALLCTKGRSTSAVSTGG